MVYPWVDLHPSGVLRPIYSGKTFTPEELIRSDAEVERRRTERMLEFNLSETAPGPRELAAEAAAIEEALPYNCEHVVCQSWFGEHEPMRGDIHHLFACEMGCNSFRGNFPYFDFPDTQEVTREARGRREDIGFEPGAGRGPVPGDSLLPAALPEPRRRLRARAHRRAAADDPRLARGGSVSDYELHRNYIAAGLQGNRNPLIDHPEWARRIDFAAAWA
jgi:endonuclease G, mitochondrial